MSAVPKPPSVGNVIFFTGMALGAFGLATYDRILNLRYSESAPARLHHTGAPLQIDGERWQDVSFETKEGRLIATVVRESKNPLWVNWPRETGRVIRYDPRNPWDAYMMGRNPFPLFACAAVAGLAFLGSGLYEGWRLKKWLSNSIICPSCNGIGGTQTSTCWHCNGRRRLGGL